MNDDELDNLLGGEKKAEPKVVHHNDIEGFLIQFPKGFRDVQEAVFVFECIKDCLAGIHSELKVETFMQVLKKRLAIEMPKGRIVVNSQGHVKEVAEEVKPEDDSAKPQS